MTSRAQKVFKVGVALNQRGSRNVPKKYLKAAAFETVGDETGYYVYHEGSFFPIKFDFDNCFWFIVKYNNQRSCWESYKLPTENFCLNIPDEEVTDPSTWGPIDNGKDSDKEDAKSEKNPESIDIKVSTKEEEKSEKQLGKLAELIPTLSRTQSNRATSRLPPITIPLNPCKPSLQKKTPLPYNEVEGPLKTHLTLDGLEGRGSPTIYQEEVEEEVAVEEAVMEEEEAVAEEVTKEITMTEDLDPS